ncbi:MAG: two pore domain potassium channel family protein [Acidobacteria bacterium]|nr:two pore domain potassium channel family protein [Acidobacteriota bacterium]
MPRPPFTSEQWRSWTEWPVTAAAVVFLVAYSLSVIADLKGQAYEDAEWVMWSVWIVFVIDYAASLLTAEHRGHWFVHHLPQFFVVALPALRPLRLLRLLSLWNVLQRAATSWVRGRISIYVAGCAGILVYIGALAELEAERDFPGSNIKDFPTSVWWAFETITTVGYGDHFPVSPEGRAIAVGLMIAGIGVLGIVTATLASWLVERVQLEERQSDAVTASHIQALTGQVELLTAQIAHLAADRGARQQEESA